MTNNISVIPLGRLGEIRKNITAIAYEKTKRRPTILPIIMEV